MHKSCMRRLFVTLFLLVLTGLGLATAKAETYTLSDGRQFSGDPITIKEDGVIIKSATDSYSPRIPLASFTQESLKALLAQAKTPQQKALIGKLLEDAPQEKAKRREIVIKPITPPVIPTAKGIIGLFSSPVGLLIFFVLYGATIFAGYEVAIYRDQPIGLVCGLAAVPLIGIASPIAFMFIERGLVPAATPADDAEPIGQPAPAASVTTELADAGAEPAPDSMAQPQSSQINLAVQSANSKFPQPIVFKRGEFTFNRRFFETKLVNFQRMVPTAADKDMVVWIKAVRGEYTGRRIVQINPDNLHLQVFKADATADEMIPFAEILEVQIRHKDIA